MLWLNMCLEVVFFFFFLDQNLSGTWSDTVAVVEGEYPHFSNAP